MWLQQRLKIFPGLLSSSWARRILAALGFLLIIYWYLSSGSIYRSLWYSGQPRGALGTCLQAHTKQWRSMAERGDIAIAHLPGEEIKLQGPMMVGNGFILVDVGKNNLWVSSATAPFHVTEYSPVTLVKSSGAANEVRASAILLREGMIRNIRCLLADTSDSARDCISIREDHVAHRKRPHLYIQRIYISNPSNRMVAFDVSPMKPLNGVKFSTSVENVQDRQFLLSSGRVPVEDGKNVLVVVASKKLTNRVQVSPKSEFDDTALFVVYTSEPIDSGKVDETFSKLREAAKKEMVEVLHVRIEDLLTEHQQIWSELFVSGIEMKKIKDLHTPSSDTINNTLYYMLSCLPAPMADPLLSSEEREKMEATLNYADHCFTGHATMHAENLWPSRLGSIGQLVQLADLWKLTLQKRGCKSLLSAGAHGLMQGMMLSFGGLQFTENHLQFQSDPHVLHNSYSLRGIHYNKDLINLAVRLDQDEKPFLHVSVKFQDKLVKLYACEAGCLNEPVELTSEIRGHTFPVLVTQPITPLLYISTDLTHLQDLQHTLHLKEILAHEEHMAKQYPGLPFLFWFSVASLITLFHLFLFKLIYNEYCGPGAKPLFRSKELDMSER
uniref:KIAA2013 n=1 Tax=Leptobrachium leishanense TaxID=445787 RepID=A0A8C5WHS0_9ANUR